MNKTITFLLIFFFSANCSLDGTSGFWSKSEKLKTENTLIEKEIFQEPEIYEKSSKWVIIANYIAWKLSGEQVTDYSLAQNFSI